ncbi:hypothetical protein ACFQGH_19090 [Halalkalicoccus tibetensis]|uniref:DUF7344 domain-containing protein n=1 Tax=Halalkalicoccus tibetensis TaxID=175632 RepID=A0ABD5V7I9_9EURY
MIEICEQSVEPVSLSDLAQEIAATEQEKEVAELTGKERKRIYTSLQQVHLPMMARANVIEYDGRTVELTEDGSDITIYMDIVPSGTVSWAVYYFGLSVISTITLIGVYFDVYPPQLPDIIWAVLITAVFGSSSIVHLYVIKQFSMGWFPVQFK